MQVWGISFRRPRFRDWCYSLVFAAGFGYVMALVLHAGVHPVTLEFLGILFLCLFVGAMGGFLEENAASHPVRALTLLIIAIVCVVIVVAPALSEFRL